MSFRDVELELVRPGPPHNQLLSPLTQYIALCGESSPITFRIEFEHRRLLSRLERLRYRESQAARERELAELGEDVGNLFGSITSLAVEVANARRDSYERADDETEIVHLRIVLSGSELSLVPFEFAIAAQAMPGEGIDMLLQGRVPIVPTREIRRSRPLPVRLDWIDEVKVLFAFCSPDGYSSVPSSEHLRELRDALKHWIGPPEPVDPTSGEASERREVKHGDDSLRLEQVKRHLRVIPDATLDDIYEACSSERFTHVHILGHGERFNEAGEERFGIALNSSGRSGGVDVVSGQRLAHALGAESAEGDHRSAPFWVTLATCDAGNQASVLVPGGSIAHDLHTHGVPWVLASQFPLSKSGSVTIARILYHRLFRGDDPRRVLYELRRYLYSHQTRYHDWASLVAYASVPPDFDDHVARFFEKSTEGAIERLMETADKWAAVARNQELHEVRDTTGKTTARRDFDQRIEDVLGGIDGHFKRWERRLPDGDAMGARRNRTVFYGMRGSIQKRLALLNSLLARGAENDPGVQRRKAEAERLFRESMDAYHMAMREFATDGGKYNWTASQYLALKAVLGQGVDALVEATCRTVAERDIHSADIDERAWAHGTLAELDLLRLVDPNEERDAFEEVRSSVIAHCREIVALKGLASFHVLSTMRQFQRYIDQWGAVADVDVTGRMTTVATEAVGVLNGTSR